MAAPERFAQLSDSSCTAATVHYMTQRVNSNGRIAVVHNRL